MKEEEEETQSCQGRPGSLLPDRTYSVKTPQDGDHMSLSTGGETSSLAFDWRSVEKKSPSPRKSHGLSLHEVVQVQLKVHFPAS